MTEWMQNEADYEMDSMKDRYLTFQIGDDAFGVEIGHVMEIIGIQPITAMPQMPDYIRGIINLRGKIISIMDVRIRFGKTEKCYDDRTCVIVMDLAGKPMGLIVDSVSDVLTISEENQADKTEVCSTGGPRYIKNIGKADGRIVFLLDCEALEDEDETTGTTEQP